MGASDQEMEVIYRWVNKAKMEEARALERMGSRRTMGEKKVRALKVQRWDPRSGNQ